jgi:hypothetical protein
VRVRFLLFGSAALALAFAFSPETIRGTLAACASALVETTPFLFAGVLCSRLLRDRPHLLDYLSCGCGRGPSARSLPAAAAASLAFGPVVAAARCLGAVLVASLLRRRLPCASEQHRQAHPLGELAAVLPAAAVAGVAMQLFAAFDPQRLSPLGNVLLGAALGFTAAPCGLGAIAVAAALRVHAPLAAAAFLCIAGIVDLRTFRAPLGVTAEHDAFAYLLLAVALGVVALRGGDELVRPEFAPAIGCCAVAALACVALYRCRRSPKARVAPLLMLIGALAGAPPPRYYATETTMTDLFPGERLTFTGALTRKGSASAIVRYAITCCRADASPVAVRLERPPPYPTGTWLRVGGRVESFAGDLRLVAERADRVAAPTDPFIYR